jgi:hypothetical protein
MKVFSILIVVLVVSSCNLPKYYFREDTNTTGVDFTTGTWLLNRIESSKNTEDRLTTLASEFFMKKTSNRFNAVYSTKILVPQKTNFPLTAEELKQIKIGSNYDYFIQIKSGQTKNQLGSIDTTPSVFNENLSNEASIHMIIYDLNKQQIIYSKNAFGVTGNPEKNSRDVTLSKSSNELIIGCLKKILRDLDEKSIQ